MISGLSNGRLPSAVFLPAGWRPGLDGGPQQLPFAVGRPLWTLYSNRPIVTIPVLVNSGHGKSSSAGRPSGVFKDPKFRRGNIRFDLWSVRLHVRGCQVRFQGVHGVPFFDDCHSI